MLKRITLTVLTLLMLTGVSFAGWGVVDVPVAHAAAGDTTWTYYGLLPSCVPCKGIIDANGNSDCVYPGDIGKTFPDAGGQADARYATYTLDGVIEFMLNIMRFIFSIAGSLALLFVVWGGFQMMASAGQSKMVEAGRKTLVNALIGVLLIFGAYTGVNFFIGGLVEGELKTVDKITGGIRLWEYNRAKVCQGNRAPNPYVPPKNPTGTRSTDGTVFLSGSQYREIGGNQEIIDYNTSHHCDVMPSVGQESALTKPEGSNCANVCSEYITKAGNSNWSLGACNPGPLTPTVDQYCCVYVKVVAGGSPCGAVNQRCGDQQYCTWFVVGQNTCQEKKAFNTYCIRDVQCLSGHCDTTNANRELKNTCQP